MIQYTSTYCASHRTHTNCVLLAVIALDAIFEPLLSRLYSYVHTYLLCNIRRLRVNLCYI